MTIDAKCPACSAKLPVVVGRKSTARTVSCSCGARFDYSCWPIKHTEGYVMHKIELFPVSQQVGKKRA